MEFLEARLEGQREIFMDALRELDDVLMFLRRRVDRADQGPLIEEYIDRVTDSLSQLADGLISDSDDAPVLVRESVVRTPGEVATPTLQEAADMLRAHSRDPPSSDEFGEGLQLAKYLCRSLKGLRSALVRHRSVAGSGGLEAFHGHGQLLGDSNFKDLVERLVGETEADIEKRLGIGGALKALTNKHLWIRVEVNGTTYHAIPYMGTPKQFECLRSVCDNEEVCKLIRHGGPWSQATTADGEPLLDAKHRDYVNGFLHFLDSHWNYDAVTSTSVWVIYTDDGDLVGRGGWQPEEELTEPFVALLHTSLRNPEKNFWNQGTASKFFLEALLPLFHRVTNNAPMRILCLPSNKASARIAESTLLPGGEFVQVRTTQERGQEYLVYERGTKAAAEAHQAQMT